MSLEIVFPFIIMCLTIVLLGCVVVIFAAGSVCLVIFTRELLKATRNAK